ncbi:Ecm11p SKDI_04G6480 [Saccharomyces kudriavzevii IFO 1802]|uniref:ECM11-like protein n=2 Tax=Saccharomyces kudriavzevii (strain ATCC MYA-4449 / AS 2.2408 / CBS 8840 / NBRC 1802 / NCYC 2889) TaxID=226230 RepID=J6ED86_SACK1|nr:uncharacterized protein SKDI_04G6480 [Saccharomyces kudriavzevii IFO 1802]EJT41657.1 ECM11-like protein [Saccharomyces kudriavzevii IFO 1802]CAI4059312.1 hypothetical protein SKDI_04G6480 [Saccharomyces kudriavzevii IFO 1802]
MTVIKTEPAAELALYSPTSKESLNNDDTAKRKENNKQFSPSTNSRSSTTKHKVVPKLQEKKMKGGDKQDLSAFLLNPSLIVKPSEGKKKENTVPVNDTPNVKTEPTGFQLLTPISKKRALKEKTTSGKYENFGSSTEEKAYAQKRTKQLPSDAATNLSEFPLNDENASSPAKEKSQEAIENPGSYQKIKNYLFDKPDLLETCLQDYSSMLPADIAEDDQEFFVSVADSTLEEWTNKGQEILDQQYQLYQEVIKKRIELSFKFKGVISVVNDRADALEEQGQKLEEKIRKIKSLANEILNII